VKHAEGELRNVDEPLLEIESEKATPVSRGIAGRGNSGRKIAQGRRTVRAAR